MKRWINSIVQSLYGDMRKPRKSTHPRARLSVETLEDRAVPATFTVTTALDDDVAHPGLTSLRQALISANNNNNPGTVDVIRFSAGLNGKTIVVSNSLGELFADQSVWVQGPGAGRLRVDGGAFTPGGGSRIFHIFSNGPEPTRFFVTGLTLQNADAFLDEEEGDPLHEGGGAIEFTATNPGESVTVRNCVLRDNFTTGVGGAIHVSGANLTITDCVFEGNGAESGGGAVSFQGAKTLVIDRSTFTENTVCACIVQAGALDIDAGATATISASTFDHNVAGSEGGAIRSRNSTVTMKNSTVSSNIVADGDGGGIYVQGGTFTLRNCTIAFNEAFDGDGGGIFVASGSLNINNTIVDGNLVTDGAGNDIARSGEGATINARFSLIRFAFVNNVLQINGVTQKNILGFSASLAPLAFNGGPTKTHAITPLSKAFHKGSVALASGLVYDQRGAPFFRVVLGFVDIGAYQTQLRRRNWGPGFFI